MNSLVALLGFCTMSLAFSAQAAPEPNLPPGVQPAMTRAEIEAGLKSRNHALYIKQGWIRDPYITLGPDYYYVGDNITGPYGPRKFLGRFLGHGTPFQTRDGKWWCTAFFNANVPPLPIAGIETRNLAENAQTINQRGTSIVPLDVKLLPNGDVSIRALDPAYATPGPDEAQKFDQ